MNVCGSIEQEHLVVNMEKILKGDPQVIVMWYNARKDPADILQNPVWQSLSAVRQQRVFELPEVFACDLWTLKYQYAVMMVAKWCYPEHFRDLDLAGEKVELLRRLYGERRSLSRIQCFSHRTKNRLTDEDRTGLKERVICCLG